MDARKPRASEVYWHTYCVICTWEGETKHHNRNNQTITAELEAHLREAHPRPQHRVIKYLIPETGYDH